MDRSIIWVHSTYHVLVGIPTLVVFQHLNIHRVNIRLHTTVLSRFCGSQTHIVIGLI